MKNNIVSVITLVIVLLLVVVMSRGLTQQRMSHQGAALGTGSAWGGLNRFLAQVNWMRLLQFRAAASSQKPSPKVADALFRRYLTVTNMDPHLEIAYEHGGLELATMGKAKQSIQLLERGIKSVNKDNWRIPYFAATISNFYLKDPDQAIKFFEETSKRAGHPFVVETSLVRLRGAKKDNDPVELAKLWWEIYVGGREMAPEGKLPMPGKGNPLPGGNMGMLMGTSGMGTEHSQAIRDKVIDILRELRAAVAAEKDAAKKADLKVKEKKVLKIVKSMIGSAYVCQFCFAEYGPGGKFCGHCGKKVKLYGVCKKCGHVVSGNFCNQCGDKTRK